ncbi:MAG: endonuclease Q family protein [Patescibacteria group bacterium]|nr:endonuclease Q family protein [Patescibacteria group bacterium]
MTLPNIALYAKKKGINVISTGDFTHPAWIKSIKKELIPAEPGLFTLKNPETSSLEEFPSMTVLEKRKPRDFPIQTRFILGTEISSIYKKGDKVRKIHNLIFTPSIESAEKINKELSKIGNLKSDGRPILGLDSKELLKIIMKADKGSILIPAHAWTPWFSIFGAMSGFDSIEECFEEMSGEIFAIETGLSSDPKMNWRLSSLDNISLISNSDAHSLQKIGREANIFDTELSYDGIMNAIKSKDKKKFLSTIEFFPEEGKYHYDGHRNCNVSIDPTLATSNICPACGKEMTIGVLHRINELADRKPNKKPAKAIPYKNTIPLAEIISTIEKVGVKSKKVTDIYKKLIESLGNEFHILLNDPAKEIERVGGREIATAIDKVRKGKVKIEPGYDGEFGKISIS